VGTTISVIKGINCKVCNGKIALMGFLGNASGCLDCGILYSTEIIERQLGHTINFKEDIDYLDGVVNERINAGPSLKGLTYYRRANSGS